ncbi:MAG: asparagine synthase (glutamine-hydrolyzing) [Rhodospirillales bacterium]|jgi:asparagine synthase (glutamine-hydrolysing)|nr:asparagine synthase (glutamine-hydrolyzing) [Rhodospirillales bacterium]
MCGISGSTAVSTSVLERMRARLGHRGPDADGLWQETDGGFGLAHTRLAIIDPSPAGAQPMVSECGRYVLAYNGAIYNFRDLRTELEAAGERFRSLSDTEVLLASLRREGSRVLSRLIGMFAFAFWDRERGELLLARDRLGLKPLVYGRPPGGALAFASEIHALEAHPGIDLGIDPEALSEYLACLYVPAPRTIRRGIRKLPPGHFLKWRGGEMRIERYWAPHFEGGRALGADEALEELAPVLRRAVADRLVADVPVGCFLSGGVDSSVVAALLADEKRRRGDGPLKTFTMTFEARAYDERTRARRIAEHLGTEHTELPASTRMADTLDDMVRAFGEPFGNPTAFLIGDLSQKAREHVSVAIAGDGGDEVFAGYPRYRGGLIAGTYRRLPGWLRRVAAERVMPILKESSAGHHWPRRIREFVNGAELPDDQMYASWVEYFSPDERQRLLGLENPPLRPISTLYRTAPSSHPLDVMQQTDLLSFLPGNLLAYGDAMSMRHGLELRLPLLDHRLVETVGRLAPEVRIAGGMKGLLRRAARKLLPDRLVTRTKRGFNPPLGLWLKSELAPLIRDRITPATMAAAGLDWPAVARILEEHERGRRDVALKVWALLVLERWQATT